MEGISTFSTSQAATLRPGTFEVNSKEFGPVGAAIIGTAQALGDVASASYSFSKEGLSHLASESEDLGNSLVDGISTAVNAVEDAAATAAHAVEDFAKDAGHAVYAAASYVGDTASDAASEVESLVGDIAGYLGMGASLASQALNEVA